MTSPESEAAAKCRGSFGLCVTDLDTTRLSQLPPPAFDLTLPSS